MASSLFILVTLAVTFSSLQAQPHNQLFSKVTHSTIPTDPSVLNDNQQQNEGQEQDPTTSQTGGYGLYGRKPTGETESGDPFDKYPQVIYNNIDDLRMSERDGYTHATRNGMNQFYNNMYRRPRRHHVNNNYANMQQYNGPQGMSDTRFLENGKYYYDLNRETEDPNGYQNWRAVALSNTQYDTFHNQNHQISGFQESYNDDDQYVP